MDLVFVETVVRPRLEAEIPAWNSGDAFVSGGTWLFSEPQPDVRRLIDLSQVAWTPITVTPETVGIAANCNYQTLLRHDWSGLPAAQLFSTAVRTLSSSFKTYGLATVGGNICLAFAKGMMTPVFITLDARYELASPDGRVRVVDASAFQTGVCRTIRQPGEYLRRVLVPAASFNRRCVLKRAAHNVTSHVIAMAIAATDPATDLTTLTLSGALAYPVKVTLSDGATLEALVANACQRHPLIGDSHGSKAYRQAVLTVLAREACEELLS